MVNPFPVIIFTAPHSTKAGLSRNWLCGSMSRSKTVLDNLYKFACEGNQLRPDGLLQFSTLSADLQAQVMTTFTDLGPDLLAPVYNALNGQVDYRELKILRLYFLSCNS